MSSIDLISHIEASEAAAATVNALAIDPAAASAAELLQPSTPVVANESDEAREQRRQHMDTLRAEAAAVAAASAALSPGDAATAAAPSQPPPPPAASTLDLIDHKVVEGKSGEAFVTFLFELRYVYPPAALAALGQATSAASASAASPNHTTIVTGLRFAEMHAFHSLLSRHFVCLPPFPDRTLTRRTDQKFLAERCASLQFYFRQILVREDVQRTGYFQKLFQIPSPAAKLREQRQQLEQQVRDAERRKAAAAAAAAPPSAAALESRHPLAQSSRYDSALGDDFGGSGSLEVHSSSHVNLAGLDRSDSASTLAAPHAPQPQEEVHGEDHGGDDADDTSEPATSEPATNSSSFAHDSAAADGGGYDSDRDFQSQMSGAGSAESAQEQQRRKKDGSRVHDVKSTPSKHASGAATATATRSHPSSVSLDFLSRSPSFAMLDFIRVDDDTLLALAADQSASARVDSWLSGLFGGKKSDRPPAGKDSALASSASAGGIQNPLGALYAFRRRAVAEDLVDESDAAVADEFAESMHVFFPAELSAMCWDAARRWIYLADTRGTLSILNPSVEFDFAVSIASALPVFPAGSPVTHAKFFASSATMASGALVLATALPTNKRHLVTVFDCDRQHVVAESTFQYNVGPNAHSQLTAIEVAPESERLFIAGSDRSISIYDMSSDRPTLLHRLANGHSAPITCLAWNPHVGVLASGGDDLLIVLWKIARKNAEKQTQIYCRLPGMHSRVRCLAWSGSDHRYLVSGDATGHVCVWNPLRKGCVLAFRAHSDAVLSVQLAQDLTLLTASTSKSAKLWSLH